jgi:ketosteroid isomerase-like protein
MSTVMACRRLFMRGAGVLAGATFLAGAARAETGDASKNEALVRRYYSWWETRDWTPFEATLSDDFTFTSPNDDHIDKAAFKKTCWDSQVDFIRDFDLEVVATQGDRVVVEYLCHTRNGKALRNVEIHRLRNLKIESIDCYFGGQASYPSAVSKKS